MSTQAPNHHPLTVIACGLVLMSAITGCSSGSSSTASTVAQPEPIEQVEPAPTPKPEFISLEQPVTVELAQLRIGNMHYTLDQADFAEIGSRIATVLYQQGTVAIDAGGESEPKAAIVIDEDSVSVLVNHDNQIQELSITSVQEQTSMVVSNEEVITVTGHMQGTPVELIYPTSMDGMGTSTITLDGVTNTVSISGTLGSRTYNQLFSALTNNTHHIDEIRLINISGSINDEVNMQTGRLIRQAGVTTVVPAGSTIASGGVDLFCAGLQRFVDPQATLLVHSWGGYSNGEPISAHELPADHPGHQQQIAYFTEMLGNPIGSDFYWFTIQSAPFGEDLHRMSDEEITFYGLETAVNQ